jgi:hypothetical protein
VQLAHFLEAQPVGARAMCAAQRTAAEADVNSAYHRLGVISAATDRRPLD